MSPLYFISPLADPTAIVLCQRTDGDTVTTREVTNIGGEPAFGRVVQIALKLMTNDHHLGIFSHTGQHLLQLRHREILRFVNNDNGVIQIGAAQKRIGDAGDKACTVFLVGHALCVNGGIDINVALHQRLIERFEIDRGLFGDGTGEPALLPLAVRRHDINDLIEHAVMHQKVGDTRGDCGLATACLGVDKHNVNIRVPDGVGKGKLLVIQLEIIERAA